MLRLGGRLQRLPTVPLPTSNTKSSMSTTFYQASIPVFIKTLTNLGTFFDKAVGHAEAANYS